MKKVSLLAFFLLISLGTGAETLENAPREFHSLEQMLNEVKLEKIQVENMVEIMLQSGRITPEEADKARRAIASVQEEDMEELKKEAIVHVKSRDLANK